MKSLRSTVLLVAATASFALSASGQTQPKPKAKPLATPPPVLTSAEIISRADDLGNPVILKAEEKPVEKKTAESPNVSELVDRVKKLEAGQSSTYDDKQKRLLLNLDILTRAEQRSESLRKQLFEMIEKENAVKSRLDQLEFDSRPEMIERSLQMAGSMKPEEIRESRRKSLIAEKANLGALLTEIQSTRASLAANLIKSDQIVEKLRTKLEKDIDDALMKDEPDFRDPTTF